MNDKKLYEDIGYIKGVVSEIKEDVRRLNGDLGNVKKKQQKHEVILGKFGLIFAGVIFFVSTVVTIIFNFIKDKFIK